MRTLRSLFLAGLVLACSHTSFAQQTVDFASVGGRAVDPTGAVVPGATVTARHIPTNIVATTTTDEAGRFRFPYLRIGPYEITASREGFTNAGRQLTLAAGSAFDLTLPLSVGGLDTSVTVSGEATTLETARSQITTTLPEAEVQQIPLNGRNFLELALLAPGAAPAAIPSTQLFPETSAVPGISLSVGSQRNLSNNFIVDGLSANDDAAGLSGMTVRRRRDRAVPDRDVRRPGGAGAGARRLRERGDAQRHQPRARDRLRVLPRRQPEREERALGARSCR